MISEKETTKNKDKPVKKPAKKKPKRNGKAGRKSHYDILCIREKLEAITGWCKQGSTDKDLMAMLGVGHDTFYRWKKTIPEFSDALKKGKEISNGEILNSAFRQSTGFYVPVNIAVKVKKPVIVGGQPLMEDGKPVLIDGKPVMINGKIAYEEVVEVVPSQEYVPPNSTMTIFMAKNRMPESYKDKHEVTHEFGTKLEDFFGGGSKNEC